VPEPDDEFGHLYYKNRDAVPPVRVAETKWRKEMERRQKRALIDGYGCLGDRHVRPFRRVRGGRRGR
jgi:hypothetical protein